VENSLDQEGYMPFKNIPILEKSLSEASSVLEFSNE
jgi:hypothetical protein